MSEESRVVRKALQRMIQDESSTRYYWLEDENFQYEAELVICRVHCKDGTRCTYAMHEHEPRGDYIPENKTIQ